MLFEQYYDKDVSLDIALSRLSAKYPTRYQRYTLKRLCHEIHTYYREHHIFELQQSLFAKKTMQYFC